MSTDAIAPAARHSAANITDPLSRAALAAQYRQVSALVTDTLDGLATAAADRDMHVDRGVAIDLTMVGQILTGLAEKIADGDVFLTRADLAAIQAERTERDAAYAANPMFMVTSDQLADAGQREPVLA